MPHGSPPLRLVAPAPADPDLVIRASSLSQYPDCMRRTAARIFPDRIAAAGFTLRSLPSGIGAATGTACHTGAAYTLGEKLRTGSLGNATEAQQRALDSLGDTIVHGVMWDQTSPDLNTAQKQVVRQLASYRREVAPRIVPLAVEERLEATLSPHVVISGQVDTAVHLGLRDLKTGTQRRANSFQYGTYSLLQRAHRRRVDFIIEDFLPRVRISAPQPPAEEHHYDVAESERAAAAIIKRMVADLRAFEATGDPWSWMANPNSMLCGNRWCPAHSTDFCRAWKDAA